MEASLLICKLFLETALISYNRNKSLCVQTRVYFAWFKHVLKLLQKATRECSRDYQKDAYAPQRDGGPGCTCDKQYLVFAVCLSQEVSLFE